MTQHGWDVRRHTTVLSGFIGPLQRDTIFRISSMTKPITAVAEAALLMGEPQIRRLPILSCDKRLVGIVALGDLAVKTKDDRLSADITEEVSKPAKPER